MKKFYIFSFGLYPEQMTLETAAALRECGAVYSHCLDQGTAARFAGLAPGLKLTPGLGHKEAAALAAASLKEHSVVGFLTYGNPLFLNQASAEMAAAARRAGARVKVFSAVSSFDALVNTLDLNKFSAAGLRLVDAAAAAVSFTPDMDTLVFVPYVLNLPGAAPARRAFAAGLKAAYPADAKVYLADCESISGKGGVKAFRAGGPAPLLAALNERHTMFIPAVRRRAKK